ncbi:MAG: Rne/Rng family ribonuclease [Actinomycetota bacterium]
MDHETEVAAPKAPADPEVDERIAAFKRGAPLPKPKNEPVPKRKAEKRPEPTAQARPEPKAESSPIVEPRKTSDGDGSSSSSSRNRRGGRGRGGRGGSTASAVGTDVTATDIRPGTEREAPAKAEVATMAEAPTKGTDDQGAQTGSPRKRRRRGGRGRGRGGAGAARTVEVDDEGVEASPADQTAASQRDDATPDTDASPVTPGERATPSSRRRRGSRGGSGGRTTAPSQERDQTGASAETEARPGGGNTRRSRAKSKQMTVEEQVAAGGPTRGIRSTRSRTGRDGRRRREPQIVPPRITDKLMVITERGERDQIAVLEEDVLVQHYVTRQGATSMVGNVYLGRVQNVLPGMEAAFVDIGRGRNGVLYAGEVNYRAEDLEGPAPRIEHVLKPSQAVIVQVTKDPMGGKGARLTAQISLPGRYLVFAPDQDLSGISRRLPDPERKRLKSILKKVKPSEHGVIVRTAAEGAPEGAIVHDLKRLVGLWQDVQHQAKKVKAPAVLYEEPELTLRVFRDLFTDEEFRGLVTDSPRVHERVLAYVRDIAPDLEPKVSLHRGKLPAFEEHRIEEQIHKALDRKVWLPSGGYLVIERTEAMTIVDVNTGKSVGKTNLEETVVNTNLEAAKEVARQLRLRDIGGIIVVDFIDMLLDKNKGQVEDTMKEAMALDKTRSQVFEIGPLGLMQVTRKRVSSGLVESFSETCPTCEGRGILINYES